MNMHAHNGQNQAHNPANHTHTEYNNKKDRNSPHIKQVIVILCLQGVE